MDTPPDTVAEVKAETLVATLADTLPEVNAETLCDKLSDVASASSISRLTRRGGD